MGAEVIKNSTSFLTFLIGSGLYGINVSKIQNIIEISRISVLSNNANSLIIGNIGLRGITLPVIDIRPKLGFAQIEYTDSTCVVAMELNINNQEILVGILVDSLNEVSEQFENDNEYMESKKLNFEQKFQLLNPEKLFNNNEIEQLIKYGS